MKETKCHSCESGECLGKDCVYYGKEQLNFLVEDLRIIPMIISEPRFCPYRENYIEGAADKLKSGWICVRRGKDCNDKLFPKWCPLLKKHRGND